jgi:hypothetical protein
VLLSGAGVVGVGVVFRRLSECGCEHGGWSWREWLGGGREGFGVEPWLWLLWLSSGVDESSD